MINKVNYLIISILFSLLNSVYAQLNADFKADITYGCKPVTVNFTDLSTGNPTGWNWDFGNGNNSVLSNPKAVYLNPGTYTVKLTVTNANGSDAVSKTAYISVFDNPKAGFSSSPATV